MSARRESTVNSLIAACRGRSPCRPVVMLHTNRNIESFESLEFRGVRGFASLGVERRENVYDVSHVTNGREIRGFASWGEMKEVGADTWNGTYLSISTLNF